MYEWGLTGLEKMVPDGVERYLLGDGWDRLEEDGDWIVYGKMLQHKLAVIEVSTATMSPEYRKHVRTMLCELAAIEGRNVVDVWGDIEVISRENEY